jgi:hypothetical protein
MPLRRPRVVPHSGVESSGGAGVGVGVGVGGDYGGGGGDGGGDLRPLAVEYSLEYTVKHMTDMYAHGLEVALSQSMQRADGATALDPDVPTYDVQVCLAVALPTSSPPCVDVST